MLLSTPNKAPAPRVHHALCIPPCSLLCASSATLVITSGDPGPVPLTHKQSQLHSAYLIQLLLMGVPQFAGRVKVYISDSSMPGVGYTLTTQALGRLRQEDYSSPRSAWSYMIKLSPGKINNDVLLANPKKPALCSPRQGRLAPAQAEHSQLPF